MRREAISTLKEEGVYGWGRRWSRVRGEEKEKREAEESYGFSRIFPNSPVLQPVRSRFGWPLTARSPGNFPPNGNTEYCRAAGRSLS